MSETIINVVVDARAKESADAALAAFGLTTDDLFRRMVEEIARRPTAIALIAIEGGDEPISPDFLLALKRARSEGVVVIDLLDRPLVPNAETIAAMEAVERGEVKTFRTIEELFADLKAQFIQLGHLG